ncbi:site-specific DNA-methyltransferase [Helicobacter pylori]|uniref:site-specific DNA-methyltransferase n=1 Tax=Helicobacter pylori TaxID=210 RepID=UPI00112B226E|nr:site-specific DNA-methyltransferase [Helicobacter pylori]TPH55884.1 site-specific DNA-methyltransferase [Helicobacter pylori]
MLKNPLKTLLDALINHFTKERLVTLILQHDEKLLIFMLEHENANDYKNAFFKTIANTLVFNEKALLECLETKELEKSFTRFKNKIGLFSQGGLIKSSELVVLNFPFKDNVLLGNAKDNSTKSNELFYHEILHKKEIDTLLSPKVLCRFEMHGEGDLENALKDKNTNYLIKGNNLIALHSLKKKFAKKVKCIYIDPPYNTGNDSFNYNDNFNHSSWLVFMKNRLEAAREFLSDDGVIFVQCDDNEQAYLKVLMDEIFLRENFVAMITCKVKSAGGLTTDTEMIFNCSEYILVYAKSFENLTYNSIKISKEIINSQSKTSEQYNSIINNIDYRKKEFICEKDNIKYYKILKGNFNIQRLSVKTMSEQDFYRLKDEIFRLTALSGGIGKKLKNHITDFTNDEDLFMYEYAPSKGKDKGIKTQYFLYKSQTITMLKNLIKADDSKKIIYKLEPLSNIFTEDFWQGISNEGQIILKNGKKPEALISRILEISTKENDLVLDFFAGSGTTCAVAHKMKRRYIGIEQMDYIETITKERLKKVIEGEQGGISKKCGFKGGGSFVYAELKEVNLEIKKQILNAKSASECQKIFETLSGHFLKRADNKMDEVHSEEFHNLDLNEQKRICCAFLDSNEDYLNLGDIDEDAWEIDEITKKYNEIFYS